MNEEEKFDELLRSKISEREFPFDDMNWDEAERLIVRQEKWRRTSRFMLIFSTGVVAGVLIMLPFILNTHNSTPNTSAVESKTRQNQVTLNDNSSAASQIKGTQPIENNVKPTYLVTSGKVRNTSKSTEKTIASDESTPQIAENRASSAPHETENASQSAQPNTNNVVAIAEKKEKTNKNTQVVDNNESIMTNTLEPIGQKESPETAGQTKVTQLKNGNDTVVSESNDTEITGVSQKKSSPVKNPSTSPPSTSNAVSYVKTKNDSDNLSPPLLRVVNTFGDTGSYSSNILSIYAGGGYSFGWNTNGVKEGNGITPWGGFAFTHYFSRKIAASIGIGYSELNGLKKTYTSSIIQYDFGANTNLITVEPKSVYYMVFPLSFQYNFNSKNRINLGADYLIMLTTRSTLSTYQQTYFSESLISSQTQNGYTQGFANYDLQLAISYTRMLTGRLGLGIEGYLGFVSVENSSFPGIIQYPKNKGGRLVLSYQIIK